MKQALPPSNPNSTEGSDTCLCKKNGASFHWTGGQETSCGRYGGVIRDPLEAAVGSTALP